MTAGSGLSIPYQIMRNGKSRAGSSPLLSRDLSLGASPRMIGWCKSQDGCPVRFTPRTRKYKCDTGLGEDLDVGREATFIML